MALKNYTLREKKELLGFEVFQVRLQKSHFNHFYKLKIKDIFTFLHLPRRRRVSSEYIGKTNAPVVVQPKPGCQTNRLRNFIIIFFNDSYFNIHILLSVIN
jgi:hypothetical protein